MFDAGFTIDALDALLLLVAIPLVWAFARSWPGFAIQAVERQQRVPWSRERVSAAAREMMLRVLFRALQPLYAHEADLPRLRVRDETRPPVLLVPDPMWGRASLIFLQIFVEHRGRVVYPVHWAAGDQSLAEMAEVLEGRIDALRRSTSAPRVDVVAFGAGGIAAAWLVRHREGTERVRRLITIGSPWRGTKMAIFRRGPLAHELSPGSLHLDGLLPPGVVTFAVAAVDDPVIIPAANALAEPRRSLALEGCGHLGLLLSARSFRAVGMALADALPAAEPAS